MVSMVLGVPSVWRSRSHSTASSVFGFIFQLFLGQSAPIDRDLIWPFESMWSMASPRAVVISPIHH